MIAYATQEPNTEAFAMDSKNGTSSNAKGQEPHLVRLIARTVGLLVLVLAAYTIYVAAHEPNPQETVVPGQKKLAAGCRAGLRILVRNRLNGKPLNNAQLIRDWKDSI